MKQVLLLVLLLSSANLFADTLEVKTMSEALSYTGNKDAITKLVITDSIQGTDYKIGSEWREFRTLDETFPNIEEIEIWTDQDIPEIMFDTVMNGYLGLFYCYEDISKPGTKPYGTDWLKKFSAPKLTKIDYSTFAYCSALTSVFAPDVISIGANAFQNCSSLISIEIPNATNIGIGSFMKCIDLISISFLNTTNIERESFNGCSSLILAEIPNATAIKMGAFWDCEKLNSVDFPKVTSIGIYAFSGCHKLTTIDFPKVTNIGSGAFENCSSLTSVSFGTNFTLSTKISGGSTGDFFHRNIFYGVPTWNVDLTLGDKVLPKPDLTYNIWQNDKPDDTGNPYYWKSIKYTGIKEDETTTEILYIDKNIYYIDNDNISDIALYDIAGKQIRKINGYIIDLNDLPIGTYFLVYFNGKKTNTEKLIRQ